MNEQWLQQLKEKMADYKRTAPEVSWNAIDQAMAQRKPQKRWLWRIAAAAVLLLTIGTGYWTLLHDLSQEEPETASTSSLASTQTPSSTPSLASTPPSPPLAKGAITQKGTSTITSTITKTSTKTGTGMSTGTGTVIPTDSVGITETEETTQSTETPEPAEHPETKQKVEPSINPNRVIYPTNLHQNKMQENRLMAKVYMSNVIVSRKNKFNDSYDYNPNPDSVSTRFRSKSKQRANYRQPIRVGVSLRYMLNNRWSLESGLTYTHLVSDNGYYETQRHNFIGLPINVGYQLWKNRHFGLYVTAGGTIEKMLEEKPWQFSVNTAFGAEYKLSRRFSIFAEPGLGYYFPNDSDIPTIYQDYPLNFNLNFGLRINIK